MELGKCACVRPTPRELLAYSRNCLTRGVNICPPGHVYRPHEDVLDPMLHLLTDLTSINIPAM